jgi:lipoate-protein ligase A
MQRGADLLDLQACQEDGIDIAPRPTGGRAILHAEEITYAFVGNTTRPPFDQGLQHTHHLLAECLRDGLARLGISTSLSRPSRDPQRQLIRQPCFTSAGRAELLVDGRKLLGSAQRRRRDTFLQHGSLLLGPAHIGIVDYMLETRHDPRQARMLRDRLQTTTTHLGALLSHVPSFEMLCDALQEGFVQRLRPDYITTNSHKTDAAAVTAQGHTNVQHDSRRVRPV